MDISTVQAAFEERFGSPPELMVRAPGRINLIGEHTDYNGGYVLPAAIDRGICLAASRRADGRFAFWAADLGEFFLSEGGETAFQPQMRWANYLLGVVSEMRHLGLPVGGLNVAFGGDVPWGAGLSSSAALGSAAALSVRALYGLDLSRMDLVNLVQRSENRFVGVPCGIMDMFASIMSRAGQALRLDCRDLSFERVPCELPGCRLLLLDSGVKHALVDGEYRRRREECEAGVAALQGRFPEVLSLRDVSPQMLEALRHQMPDVVYRRCRFVVEEIGRVEQACAALGAGRWEELGQHMYACHEGLDGLYGVCVPQTNFLVQQARLWPGGLGARQVGGGFGGCVLLLLRESAVEGLGAALRTAYEAAFGLQLAVYPVRLSDGAAVLTRREAS